jgi:hypothetical protein
MNFIDDLVEKHNTPGSDRMTRPPKILFPNNFLEWFRPTEHITGLRPICVLFFEVRKKIFHFDQ